MKNGFGTCDASEPRYVVVGTAGHIDHGKTALVYALTGTDTDRLPEEKRRGITIDLGFAALDVDAPSGGKLHLSLIDVPGHHAFVRNMLAGAGGIDCVMLVIAADEGVKPQTEEHLAICNLLGIERGIVVLTKADAVSAEQLAESRSKVERFLRHTFLEGAPILAVSALRGQGIGDLKKELAKLAESVPVRNSEQVFRLPLDRAFSMRGFGTVVTGTLHAGVLHSGETVEQLPVRRELRIRGLQVHGKSAGVAHAPCRVALNVAGVELGQIRRGDTLTEPGTLMPTTSVDIALSMLPDAPRIKHGGRVRVHAFTSDAPARILLFGQKDTSDAGAGFARLRIAEPMVLLPGDRVVLRQCSPARTIGGGTVLDIAAPAGARKAKVLEWLKDLRAADDGEQLRLRIARWGVNGISATSLIAETGLTADSIERRTAPMIGAGRVVRCGGSQSQDIHWISSEGLEEAREIAQRVLLEAGSLSRAELRSKAGLNGQVMAVVLERMVASGTWEASGDSVRIAGRGHGIPELKRRQMQRIETIYANAGLAAPLLSDVMKELGVTPPEMRELITLLLRSKRLIRMGSDEAFVHPDALARLYTQLREHRGESFDVGRFKGFTGLTRKHAIPLLEHLDQARVTRNNGGTRVVL